MVVLWEFCYLLAGLGKRVLEELFEQRPGRIHFDNDSLAPEGKHFGTPDCRSQSHHFAPPQRVLRPTDYASGNSHGPVCRGPVVRTRNILAVRKEDQGQKGTNGLKPSVIFLDAAMADLLFFYTRKRLS